MYMDVHIPWWCIPHTMSRFFCDAMTGGRGTVRCLGYDGEWGRYPSQAQTVRCVTLFVCSSMRYLFFALFSLSARNLNSAILGNLRQLWAIIENSVFIPWSPVLSSPFPQVECVPWGFRSATAWGGVCLWPLVDVSPSQWLLCCAPCPWLPVGASLSCMSCVPDQGPPPSHIPLPGCPWSFGDTGNPGRLAWALSA